METLIESPLQVLVTYIALTLIIQLRYFLIVGPLHWMLWSSKLYFKNALKLSKAPPNPKTIKHEIKLSLISSFIYAAPTAVVLELWKEGSTAIYSTAPADIIGWLWVALSMIIYLLVQDAWFFWTHRLMHTRKFFKWTHAGHHKSIQPTPWASFSFDPLEALSSAWLLPVLALIIPIHIYAALALLMIMTVNAIFNHAGWEIYPQNWLDGWWGKNIITASHHNLHHTNFKGNYGLYFRFWDKLCGTDVGLFKR
jgi:sterol desaturase/sphingolipid hydroxylase (fatty acid hydroxylase superfamily)